MDFNEQAMEKLSVTAVKESSRMTPQMHQTAHVRASFGLNCIVRVKANDPCEGQPALVELVAINDIVESYLTIRTRLNKVKSEAEAYDDTADDEFDTGSGGRLGGGGDEARDEFLTNYKLLHDFPGPLTKEHTSKAQIIQFCQRKQKECLLNANLIDPQSHSLLWDYLSILIRQNGVVDIKTDISSLLLSGILETGNEAAAVQQQQQAESTMVQPRGKKQLLDTTGYSIIAPGEFKIDENGADQLVSVTHSNQTAAEGEHDSANMRRLRQLLGTGLKSDAIDHCVKHNMWSHALFIASTIIAVASVTPSGSNAPSASSSATGLANSAAGSSSNHLSSMKAMLSMQSTGQSEVKQLQKVKIRFLASLPQNDPISTCYQLLIGKIPSIASVGI
jgi:hypothetical protein